MFVMPYEKYVKNDTNAHVTISSWRRIDDNMIPARGKVAGAYANSALIKTDANRCGLRRGTGAGPERARLGRLGHEHLHGAGRRVGHAAGDR